MRIKRILALTGLAWAITLPPALSTSCSSKLEFELNITEGDGVHLTRVKAYENTDLIVPYTLTDGKEIDPLNSSVSINLDGLNYWPYPTWDPDPVISKDGFWTIKFDERKIYIWGINIKRSWPKNNHIYLNIASK